MLSTVDPEKKKRLIVLVPDCLAGNPDLAHKVYWMAIRDQCEVLYLALVDNEDYMLSTVRYMAIMRAVTSGNNLVVESKLTETALWLKTLREIYHPGDRIVCHEEQFVKNGFQKMVPITDFLQSTLHVPTITISGFYHPQRVQISQWARSLAAWLGFLVILVGFTMLEIRFDYLFQSTLGKIFLCVLMAIELMAIWGWNKIIG